MNLKSKLFTIILLLGMNQGNAHAAYTREQCYDYLKQYVLGTVQDSCETKASDTILSPGTTVNCGESTADGLGLQGADTPQESRVEN